MHPESVPQYVAVMLGPKGASPPWKETVRQQLAEWGVRVDKHPRDRGRFEIQLDDGVSPYGLCELLDPLEARSRYESASFLDYQPPCPFLRDFEIAGYIAWQERNDAGRADWIVPLTKEGYGLIARVGSDAPPRPAVIQVAFSLAGLLDRWGFRDGSAFLTRETDALHDYRGYVCSEIERVLRASGIELGVSGPLHTSHNPFQLDLDFHPDGSPMADATRIGISARVSDLSVVLWAFDLDIADDAQLFSQTP